MEDEKRIVSRLIKEEEDDIVFYEKLIKNSEMRVENLRKEKMDELENLVKEMLQTKREYSEKISEAKSVLVWLTNLDTMRLEK